MTTYNTGNALGSSDARDLYDNAENFDNFANGAANTYQDRLGVTRKSLAGMNAAFDDFIESSGYTVPVAYTSGIVLTEYNQLIEYNDEFYKLKAGQAPYTTTGTWGTDSAKLVAVGDAALRQELAAGDGASKIGYQLAGGVVRDVAGKFGEFVSVLDFITEDINTATVDCSAYIQDAINKGKAVDLGGIGVVLRVETPVTYTGRVHIVGRGAKIKTDIAWLQVTDGSGSVVDDIELENITTPYTIQRNYTTWAAQTVSDVTQKNTGYMPTGNDNDFWSSLSAGIKAQNISPTILFKSSSSTPNTDVSITRITGRFVCIKLEGYQRSTVSGCSYSAGFGDGICFWNGLDVSFPHKTPLGFTLARGDGNKAIGNTITNASFNGIAFWGNDNYVAAGNTATKCGESGIKTGQKENSGFDNPYPAGAVCYNGVVVGNTCTENRYDGIDANSVYYDNTTPFEDTYSLVTGNTVRNNRSTGIVSNSNSITITGNTATENGVFGIRSIGANCKVLGNTLTNNVTHPGILGAMNSYDLLVMGSDSICAGNNIFRGSDPAYTYAVYISGAVKYINNTSNKMVFLTSGAKHSYVTNFGAMSVGEFVSEYPWGGAVYGFDAEPMGVFGARQYSALAKNAYYDGANWRRKNANGDAPVLIEQTFTGGIKFSRASSDATGSAISWTTWLELDPSGNVIFGSLPTSSSGLPTGGIWVDAAAGNVLKMVP